MVKKLLKKLNQNNIIARPNIINISKTITKIYSQYGNTSYNLKDSGKQTDNQNNHIGQLKNISKIICLIQTSICFLSQEIESIL